MNTDGGSGLRQKSNSAKLYLHVGPPKTATTSLQFALQSGNGPFVYMGVTQPRGIKEQENSALLHNAIAGKFVNVESVESVLGRIRQAINTDNNVVISDEMFLVDGLVNHQVKLARLSESLNDIPVVLIISLRNPTAKEATEYRNEMLKVNDLYQQLKDKPEIEQTPVQDEMVRVMRKYLIKLNNSLVFKTSEDFDDVSNPSTGQLYNWVSEKMKLDLSKGFLPK